MCSAGKEKSSSKLSNQHCDESARFVDVYINLFSITVYYIIAYGCIWDSIL